MAKIVVTGSTGFIGSHLVRALKAVGHEVIETLEPTECDIIYHLACPATTAAITANPTAVMDTILDVTRRALNICQTATFVNISSEGAKTIDDSPQGAYNVAKRCMEIYVRNSNRKVKNYRLPAVYGEGMHSDHFIKKCVDGVAYKPTNPDQAYYIAHVDDVVASLVDLTPIVSEHITLGKIYEDFSSWRRGLHRPTFNKGIAESRS